MKPIPFLPRTALLLAASCAPLAACGGGDEPPPRAETPPVRAPDSATTAQPADTAPRITITGGPGEPYVERGACPFECCTYGGWKADSVVPVYAREGDTTAVAFSLAAGERFTARTGNVHVTTVGMAVTRDTVTLAETDPAGPLRLSPGDTVYVLSPVGEGFYHLWHGGRVYEAAGFWEVPHTDPANPDGTLLRRPAFAWWAQVENARGQRGWIAMHAAGRRVRGADACGGPIE